VSRHDIDVKGWIIGDDCKQRVLGTFGKADNYETGGGPRGAKDGLVLPTNVDAYIERLGGYLTNRFSRMRTG
jgi:hypothetical protein